MPQCPECNGTMYDEGDYVECERCGAKWDKESFPD